MYLFRLSLGLICLILIGCSKPNPEPQKNEKLAIADRVSRECAKTLSKRYGMVQSGEGGAMMYEIEDLFLAFDIHRSLSKGEARAMLIDCAHEVITTANSNQEIQKYLLPSGFNEKSVQIQIFITPDYKDNYYPDLGVCSYNFGKLAYRTYNPDDKYSYKTSERETYDEAIALLENPDTSERYTNN